MCSCFVHSRGLKGDSGNAVEKDNRRQLIVFILNTFNRYSIRSMSMNIEQCRHTNTHNTQTHSEVVLNAYVETY